MLSDIAIITLAQSQDGVWEWQAFDARPMLITGMKGAEDLGSALEEVVTFAADYQAQQLSLPNQRRAPARKRRR